MKAVSGGMMKLLDGTTLASVAMARLREFDASALHKSPDGYWLAYSGGKDSVVLLDLVKQAGVTFRAVHNLTTCDPPELVQFVRRQPQVEIHKPAISMWNLIRKKGMPPRRKARYCCEALKECGGAGHVVLTGVRWSESNRRRSRRMVESCYRDGSKTFLHPIIDWPTDAVWEYIRDRELSYCSLYDEGFKRLGCVLCPMTRDVERQMARWPQLARAWEKAVKATYSAKKDNGYGFTSAEEYWQWWLDRDAPARMGDSQPVLFADS